ncbi:MAG: xanthine dehydrogenase family protein subunit M [Firmicutes bacterium]|nr:xanthine dehydrogenase family protein subunit M [Bacillota bacterium]
MPKFELLEPADTREALSLLSELGERARLLAGGTDLMVNLRRGRIRPEYVVRILSKEGLQGFSTGSTGLRIGAMATIREVAVHPAIKERFPALARAALSMATPQVRNRATIGGNLCNASPAADTAPPLLVHDAEVDISGAAGSRTMPLRDFFQGPGAAALQAGEILTAIRVPDPGTGVGAAFIKLGVRKAQEIAIVSVAVLLRRGAAGQVDEARIALGAVAPTPLRVPAAEDELRSRPFSLELAARAAGLAASAVEPIDDVRATAEYRRAMAGVLVERALVDAWEKAAENCEG